MRETIQELKALREKATQGIATTDVSNYGDEWWFGGDGEGQVQILIGEDGFVGVHGGFENDTDRYIVALHNKLPDLLAYIDELEGKADAGEKLAKAVWGMDVRCDVCGNIKRGPRDAALEAYKQAVKE